MLLNRQKYASPQRGLPVDDKGYSSQIVTISGETVNLYYFSGTTPTLDAGQAAGTMVVGQLAFHNIKNYLGNMEATHNDTSLSFTSTALTSEVAYNHSLVEEYDHASLYNRAVQATNGFSNGQFCVDYTNGTYYGLKADSSTSLTSVSYKVLQGASAGATTVTASENIAQIGGVSITAASTLSDGTSSPTTGRFGAYVKGFNGVTWDRIRAGISNIQSTFVGFLNSLPYAIYRSSQIARTNGQAGPLESDDLGNLRATLRSYDTASGANKEINVNPLNQQYLEETLVDTTNVAAATNYYPSTAGMPMAGYKNLCVQGMISGGVTATIEATNDDAASPDWLDITKAGYEITTNVSGGASFVDTNFYLDFENLNVKAVRIKSVTSDATNAVQYGIRRTY